MNRLHVFYLKAVLFGTLMVCHLTGFDYLSMQDGTREFIAGVTNSSEYIGKNVGTDEIVPIIRKAETKDGTTKLIIGDSVCRQLFKGLQEYNKDVSILGSNGAITMAGQYILAKEYLDSHPDATDIFLLVLPKSIARTYDTKWGYQYLVMPFTETDTLKYLEPDTIDCLKGDIRKPLS